jgi:hypothetical protein
MSGHKGELVKAKHENAKVQMMIWKHSEKESAEAPRTILEVVRTMYRAGSVAIIIIFSAAVASGQIASSSNSLASSNVFVGYSFFADNLFSGQHASLSGWHVSGEKKYLPYFGIVGDVSGTYGSTNSTCASSYPGTCLVHASISEYTFQTGIRGAFASKNIRPFGEALFGAARTGERESGLSNSNLGFAATLGAGLDCRITSVLGCRAVVDYVVTGNFANARQNSIRASTGLVFRF